MKKLLIILLTFLAVSCGDDPQVTPRVEQGSIYGEWKIINRISYNAGSTSEIRYEENSNWKIYGAVICISLPDPIGCYGATVTDTLISVNLGTYGNHKMKPITITSNELVLKETFRSDMYDTYYFKR